MRQVQQRALPRLMLDAVSCIQLAYGDLDDDLRAEARHHIASLLHTDVTDVETAIAALRTVAQQLRAVRLRCEKCKVFVSVWSTLHSSEVKHLTYNSSASPYG